MLFGNYILYINGMLLAHCHTVESELTSEDAEAFSVALGFVGITPGPDVRRFDFSNLSPNAGEDFDFEQAKLNRTECEFRLVQIGSGKSATSTGYIMNVRRRGGTGQNSDLQVTAVGTPSAMA